MSVAVEIAGSDSVPAQAGTGADRPAADEGGPVHLPDRDLAAAGVLKKDVGMSVATEMAGSDRFQLGPGLGLIGPPPISLLPFISQIETWPVLVF